MARAWIALGGLITALLVACTGSSSATTTPAVPSATATVVGDATAEGGAVGGAVGGAAGGPTAAAASVVLIAVTEHAVVEIGESGESRDLGSFAKLGVTGEDRPAVRWSDGLIWVATKAGQLVAIDPTSELIDRTLNFGSTQPIVDFGFRASLVWVLVGVPDVDAILLAADRESGELVFVLDPPPGSPLRALGVGEGGVWVSGGSPESETTIAEIDSGAGRVARSVDVGIEASQVAVTAGGVWIRSEDRSGAGGQIVRVDSSTGVAVPIEMGVAIAGPVEADGSIWALEAWSDAAGMNLVRIDPGTGAASQVMEIERTTDGEVALVASDGMLIAFDGGAGVSYVVEPGSGAVVATFEGDAIPVAVR